MSASLPLELLILVLKFASGFPRRDVTSLKERSVSLYRWEPHQRKYNQEYGRELGGYAQRVLVVACLVSKKWRQMALPLLYRSPVFPRNDDNLDISPHWLFLRTIAESSLIASYVQDIDLTYPDCKHPTDTTSLLTTLRSRLSGPILDQYENMGQQTPMATMSSLAIYLISMEGVVPEVQICKATLLSLIPNVQWATMGSGPFELCQGLQADSLPNLVWLEVWEADSLWQTLRFDHLHWLASAAPCLKTLALYNLQYGPEEGDLLKVDHPVFRNVTYLLLHSCATDDANITSLLRSFPRLKQLDFIYPRRSVSGETFIDALAEHTPKLRHLRVHYKEKKSALNAIDIQPMKFSKSLAQLESLQKLWVPLQCFGNILDVGRNPTSSGWWSKGLAQVLPTEIQQLSLFASNFSPYHDMVKALANALSALAEHLGGPWSRFPHLRTVVISAWQYQFGPSEDTAWTCEVTAMQRATSALHAKGVKLVVVGAEDGKKCVMGGFVDGGEVEAEDDSSPDYGNDEILWY